MDQDVALCPNVLRQSVCKLTHALQCEEVRVTFAKVCVHLLPSLYEEVIVSRAVFFKYHIF